MKTIRLFSGSIRVLLLALGLVFYGLNLEAKCLKGTLFTDQQALIKFYTAMGNPNLLNWGKNPDMNTWEGVTVQNNRVTRLMLPNKGLIGILDPSFKSLDALQYLDLSGNPKIGGTIDISCMSQLAALNISATGLSNFITEGLTPIIYSSLSYLALHTNEELSGTLDITNMPALEDLLAYETGFQVFKTNTTQTYENLGNIRLENAAFSGILNIYQMPSVETLMVQNNNFDQIVASPDHRNLREINLANNLFTFDDFAQIPFFMKILDLTFSPQEDVLSVQTLDLTAGQTLNISAKVDFQVTNSFQWKKDGVNISFTSEELNKPNVATSDAGVYTCEITNPSFLGLTLQRRAVTVNVEGCGGSLASDQQALNDFYVAMGSPSNLSGWGSDPDVNNWEGVNVSNGRVTVVNIPSKSLSGTLPTSFSNLTALTYLYIGNNNGIKGTLDISCMQDLETLQAFSCDLSELKVEETLVGFYSKLKLMSVSNNNNIAGILNIKQMPVLETLNAAQTALTSITVNKTNSYYSILKSINLSQSEFTGELDIENMPQIETVNVLQNDFSELLIDNVNNRNLKYLYIDNNNFGGVLNIKDLTDLIRVQAQYNDFSVIITSDAGSDQYETLEYLNIGQNLSLSGKLDISRMYLLKNLNAGGTQIEELVIDKSQPYSSFTTISIANNPNLKGELDISKMPNLTDVLAFSTGLETLITSNTNSYPGMVTLKLYSSDFKGKLDVSKMPMLEELQVRNNAFNEIVGGDPFIELYNVTLENNNFTFDDLAQFPDKNYGTFTYAPQADVGQEKSYTIEEGTGFKFNAQVDFNVTDDYLWEKQNGSPLANNTSVEYGKTTSALDDAGVYICTITNSDYNQLALKHKPITLTVVKPADPVGFPINITKHQSNKLRFNPDREHSILHTQLAQGQKHRVFPDNNECIIGTYDLQLQLRYDRGNRNYLPDWMYSLNVDLILEKTGQPEQVLLQNQELKLEEISADNKQTWISTIVYETEDGLPCDHGAEFKYYIRINSIDQSATLPDNLYLDFNLFQKENLIFQDQPISLNTFKPSGGENYLSVIWDMQQNTAERFELEWVYLDNYERNDHEVQKRGDHIEAFDYKEPVRVELNPDVNEYPITLTYPAYDHVTKAAVFCRIRAVGREPIDPDNPGKTRNLVYGEWNYPISGSEVVELEKFEENLNWNVVTSFAEEGKYKKVVSYMDGSLRNRQTLTNLSTDQNTMVAESMYDFEGRASIGTLPVPIALSGNATMNPLKYQSGFNSFSLSDLKNKEVFDNSSLASQQMDQTNGAAKYYSPANNVGGIHRDHIPNANGFVYTQTQYTNDGTGRVKVQSGLGETFKLRKDPNTLGDHVTQYFYATPSASELYRLFGENVGLASHYKKVAVKDANGQVSVSYKDQEGRTIATALAGKNPDNMEALDSYLALAADPNRRITESLIGNNILDKSQQISRSASELLNTEPDTYDFEYTLNTGKTLLTKGTSDTSDDICIDCIYELHISIIEPNGVAKDVVNVVDENDVAYDDEDASNTFVFTITPQMCQQTEQLKFKFSSSFDQVGTYQLVKELRLKSGGFERIVNELKEQKSLDTYINEYWTTHDVENLLDGQCEICADETKADAQGELNDVIGGYAESDCQNILSQIAQQQEAYWLAQSANQGEDDIFPEYGTADWWTEINKHPEICHYNACIAVKESGSTDFDVQMALTTSWTEAQSNNSFSLTNPLGMSEGGSTTGTQDPFFTDPDVGAGFYNQMKQELLNVKGTATASDPNGKVIGDIWTITNPNATTAGTHPDLYGPEGHIFFMNMEEGETEDERRWKVFRNLYSGIKKDIQVEWEKTFEGGCNFLDAPATGYDYVIVKNPIMEIPASNGSAPSTQDYVDYINTLLEDGTLDGDDLLGNTSDEQVDLMIDMMEEETNFEELDNGTSCNGLVNFTLIRQKIVEYFAQQKANNIPNPLGVLFEEDMNVAPLSVIRDELAKCPDGIQLVAVAQPDPMKCVETETIYKNPISGFRSNGFGGLALNNPIGNIDYNTYEVLSLNAYIQPDLNQGGSIISKKDLNTGVGYDLRVTQDGRLTVSVKDVNNVELYAETDAGTLNPLECQYISVFVQKFSSGSYKVSFYFGQQDTENYDPYYNYPGPQLPTQTRLISGITLGDVSNNGMIMVGTDGYNGGIQWVRIWKRKINALKETIAFWKLNEGQGLTGLDYSGNNLHLFLNQSLSQWGNAGCLYQEVEELCTKYAIEDSETYTFTTTLQDLKDACIAKAEDAMRELITEKYYEEIVTTMNTSMSEYYNGCFDTPFDEDFTYEHTPTEYHYMLYYYDQAGNLSQTVPPKGVVPLNLTAAEIKDYIDNPVGNPLPETQHQLKTRYQKNTLGQVEWQQTPDAGMSRFWYDIVGNLRLSQNSEQLKHKHFSYSKLDGQNRIIEVGQIDNNNGLHNLVGLDPLNSAERENVISFLEDKGFPNAANYALTQITETYYDNATNIMTINDQEIDYLRGRVAYTSVKEDETTALEESVMSFYVYDIHGNVKSLVNMQPGLGIKCLNYEYDLINNSLHNVIYQQGAVDQFIHHYSYDADNRLIDLKTSLDGYLWDTDAKYFYYAHGSLARIEFGEYEVQGLDYNYTLQGWIKGVNKPGLIPELDPGYDGYASHPTRKWVSRDVYAYQLNYFDGDYQALVPKSPIPNNPEVLNNASSSLFNGNIASMITDLGHFEENSLQAMVYSYDQLNRIKSGQAWSTIDYQWQRTAGKYDVSYSYDAMGNLKNLSRNNSTSSTIDDLNYNYYWYNKSSQQYQEFNSGQQIDLLPTNRLLRVEDNSGDELGLATGQQEMNYEYDATGNLIKDVSEGITNIEWTIQGKVNKVTRGDGSWTSYKYDATGNRINKTVFKDNFTTNTYYSRDANGDLVSVYVSNKLKEQNINIGNRIGTYNAESERGKRTLGNKTFQLTNHLSNVLTTISDNKMGIDESNNSNVDYYTANVMSATDYYPFGMVMKERSYQNEDYRIGFNGKENDKDFGSEQLIQDYGFRLYNSSVGKFLSVDPLTPDYPWYTPYQFAGNDVIRNIDVDGLEPAPVIQTNPNVTTPVTVQANAVRQRFTRFNAIVGDVVVNPATGNLFQVAAINSVQFNYYRASVPIGQNPNQGRMIRTNLPLGSRRVDGAPLGIDPRIEGLRNNKQRIKNPNSDLFYPVNLQSRMVRVAAPNSIKTDLVVQQGTNYNVTLNPIPTTINSSFQPNDNILTAGANAQFFLIGQALAASNGSSVNITINTDIVNRTTVLGATGTTFARAPVGVLMTARVNAIRAAILAGGGTNVNANQINITPMYDQGNQNINANFNAPNAIDPTN